MPRSRPVRAVAAAAAVSALALGSPALASGDDLVDTPEVRSAKVARSGGDAYVTVRVDCELDGHPVDVDVDMSQTTSGRTTTGSGMFSGRCEDGRATFVVTVHAWQRKQGKATSRIATPKFFPGKARIDKVVATGFEMDDESGDVVRSHSETAGPLSVRLSTR